MANAIPARIASNQFPRSIPYTTTRTEQKINPRMEKFLTIRPVSFCNNVSSSFTDWRALPIVPISVLIPMPVTSATPCPLTTKEPE